jgi:hypothetical protein
MLGNCHVAVQLVASQEKGYIAERMTHPYNSEIDCLVEFVYLVDGQGSDARWVRAHFPSRVPAVQEQVRECNAVIPCVINVLVTVMGEQA